MSKSTTHAREPIEMQVCVTVISCPTESVDSPSEVIFDRLLADQPWSRRLNYRTMEPTAKGLDYTFEGPPSPIESLIAWLETLPDDNEVSVQHVRLGRVTLWTSFGQSVAK